MESSLFSKEKMNRCRKKLIPWHVQQRYMESFSQLSLNQTISAAQYRKKIKSLQRNNKHLALALQRSRYLATDKENLVIDNGKFLDIINFSRVKLMDMAKNMKQATECLDETLLLLNSSLTESLTKQSPCNQSYRNDFKYKLQEISRNSPIEEVSENSDSPNKNVQSFAQKGKISRLDGCVFSPNKKVKLTKKERTIKTNSKDLPKSAVESSATLTSSSKNAKMNNSKKCDSALNIKSQTRKKSFPKNSNIKTASSSKLPMSNSSNHFLQAKTKQESLDKKRKAVKVILTDIAEAFLTQETENYRSPVKKETISTSHGTNFKCFAPNSPEDDILIKKYFSSEHSYKQRSSASNSYRSQFTIVGDAEIPHCSQNISDFLPKSLCFDIPEIDEKSPALVEEDNFDCGENNSIIKMDHIEGSENIAKQNNGSSVKKTDSEKDKRSHKPHSLKVANRMQFYYDEDAIEKVEVNTVASKDRIRKPINKCKARKTISHKKKNIPSECTALKSNLILPDNVSKLGKNSFLVTAEVHPPPNGIYAQEKKSKLNLSQKLEPCVVLTDIFKSNRGLLSEMVGNDSCENAGLCSEMVGKDSCVNVGLEKTVTKSTVASLSESSTTYAAKNSFKVVGNNSCENEGLEKTVTKSAVAPLSELNTTYAVNKNSSYKGNDLNAADMECENSENRCLPEDREIIEQEKHRRRSKIVSYKEPSLNVKMRRLF